MRILHLTLKKKWFDMIASGEKKEEYREIKPYWISRLVDGLECPSSWEVNEGFAFEWPVNSGRMHSMRLAMPYDAVCFARGGHFHKSIPQMTVKLNEIKIGTGNPVWGAEPGKEYFVIKLGELLTL